MHIGVFNWASTRATGQFACPSCRSTQPYRHRAIRPFLTVYFVPIIPIGGLKESVECKTCKGSFELNVLAASVSGGPSSTDNARATNNLATDLGMGMAAIMCDDGIIDELEIQAAIFAFPVLSGETLTREKLAEYCRWIQQMRLSSGEFIQRGYAKWGETERVLVLQGLFYVASATGSLSARRNQTITACKELFQMTDDQFEGAINQVLQWN